MSSEAAIALKRSLKELHFKRRAADNSIARLEREERIAIRDELREKRDGDNRSGHASNSGRNHGGRRDADEADADSNSRSRDRRSVKRPADEDDTIAYVDAATIPKKRFVRRDDKIQESPRASAATAPGRLMSAVVVVSSSATQGDTAAEEEMPQAAPPPPRPVVALPSDLKQRGKRLFGALLGHLNSARTKLTTDEESSAAKRKRTVEQRVEKRLGEMDQQVVEAIKIKYSQKKKAERQAKFDLLKEIAVKQAELLRTINVDHLNTLANFIMTKAEPKVFWLPTQHTDVSRQLLEESAAALQQQAQAIVIEPQTVDEQQLAHMEDDDSKHPDSKGDEAHGGSAEHDGDAAVETSAAVNGDGAQDDVDGEAPAAQTDAAEPEAVDV